MKILSSKIYRIIAPKFIRKQIVYRVLRADVLNYYANLSEPVSDEIEKVLDYLRNRSVAMFPYYFQDQYIEETIEVFKAKEKRLRYVMLDGKKLYFKRRWSNWRIRGGFNELRREQDLQCPHRYENENFKVENGDVLVDVGVAEGNFALSVVERASRIILFESNKEWMEPLMATFEPWKDKVTIVKTFVGDVSNSTSTTLDDYFEAGEKLSFLKIDIEGAESRLLDGCIRILREQHPLKVAICTYHKPEDEQEFRERLTQNGFATSPSDGFVLLFTDRNLKSPFLRRGLLRAVKN